jgi:hypothetical protein
MIMFCFVSITVGLFMFTYGLIKTVEKIREIEMWIQKIHKQLDEHDKLLTNKTETK